MAKHLFTSESVTEGHPDKICDQISDAVLDAIYEKDNQARVACETTVTTGQVVVMGEISTNAQIDVAKIAKFYNGGGHVRAAGFTMSGSFYDIVNNISDSIAIQLGID